MYIKNKEKKFDTLSLTSDVAPLIAVETLRPTLNR